MSSFGPIVPTVDADVRHALRCAGAPLQLFGEGAQHRRRRLEAIMVEQGWRTTRELREACGFTSVRGEGGSSASLGKSGAGASSGSSEVFSRGPLGLAAFREEHFRMSAVLAYHRTQELKRDSITFQQLGAAGVKTLAQQVATLARGLHRTGSYVNVRTASGETTESVLACDAGGHESNDAGDRHAGTLRVSFTAVAAVRASAHTIATGDASGVVTLWNTLVGEPLASAQSHHVGYGRVESIATAHRSPLAFSCARNLRSISVWKVPDPSTGVGDESAANHQLHRLADATSDSLPHHGTYRRVTVDPTDRLLAASSTDCVVRVWDVRHCEENVAEYLCALDGLVEGRSLYDVAFHPDGSLLCVTDGAGRCAGWDMRSGKAVFCTSLAPHVYGPCTSVLWSPCGLYFVTGGADHTLQVWDTRQLYRSYTSNSATTGEPVRSCARRIAAHLDVVTGLSFVPHNSAAITAVAGVNTSSLRRTPILLCSSSLDGSVHVWDWLHLGRRVHSLHMGLTEGPVRSHCWVEPQGSESESTAALELITISRSPQWSAWRFGGLGNALPPQSSRSGLSEYKYVVTLSGGRQAAPLVSGSGSGTGRSAPQDDANAGEEVDDDDMQALRAARPRTSDAAATGSVSDPHAGSTVAAGNDSEGDDEDVNALRRR